ncbi:MAG: hypothetical protein OXQ30_16720 [Boseongicola sp.]|nr:hypothetical protein [Boseongicola sp.]
MTYNCKPTALGQRRAHTASTTGMTDDGEMEHVPAGVLVDWWFGG